jgi:allantoate deiminase
MAGIKDASAIDVSPQLVQRQLGQLGRIGLQPDGGLVRLLYDAAWRDAMTLVEKWMRQAGLLTRQDAVGNVFGRLPGTMQPERTILTGSHIDTVRHGGRYDGSLGIVGGIAALSALQQLAERPRQSLEVVAICEEESSRIAGNLFGSRGMLGLTDTTELATLTDLDGIPMTQMMTEVGLNPTHATGTGRDDVDRFVELHIEQGPVLDETGVDIGIVSDIAGMRHQLLTVSGQPDHAGAAPMDRRRDAMQSAAMMTIAIDDIVRRAGAPAVATVGQMRACPGAINVVAERVTFSLDLRHPSDAARLRLLNEIDTRCRHIATEYGVSLDIADRWEEQASTMDGDLQHLLAETSDSSGFSWSSLPSGAAHDSQLWARHVPTSMIFVPSVDGRSHCPTEYTQPHDCVCGATLLARALYQLAY